MIAYSVFPSSSFDIFTPIRTTKGSRNIDNNRRNPNNVPDSASITWSVSSSSSRIVVSSIQKNHRLIPFLSHNHLKTHHSRMILFYGNTNQNNDELGNNNNEMRMDDEDDAEEKPYKNRSLYWTTKYRQLLPYHTIRQMVHKMGFHSKEEWDDVLQDGGVGPYIPNHPDEMYPEEWESWDDFLGIMRSYHDTKYLVQHVLQFTNITQYQNFIQHDIQRAENLRLPANPQKYYQHVGTWISYHDFFGTSRTNSSSSLS
jgi:hypothetical protein